MEWTIKHTLTIVCLLLSVVTHAQAPLGIPYQAAARNSSGAVLVSTAISVRFTIRQSIATGTILYRETHSTTTDANGMFSVNVGQGTPVSGSFVGINWGTNAKFMQVELDPTGGSSYTDMGTQQMMSVPYALHTGSIKLTASTTGDTLNSGNGNYVIVPGISAANCTVTAGTITGTSTLTIGNTDILSNATTGGVWSSGAPGIATVGSTGFLTGLAAGTATISYTVTNGCGTAVATKVVTVIAGSLLVGSGYRGGIIGYILQPSDPGYIAGEIHGLIVTTSDLSTGINWGCYGTAVGGTSTAIGTGAANTAIISAACAEGTAARLCDDLVLNGYSDWYLPSRNELQKLYNNRVDIIWYSTSRYWSSSESSPNHAWEVYFSHGYADFYGNKNFTLSVRAVRSF